MYITKTKRAHPINIIKFNFCLVPGPINEAKLSDELDNFARSLRIKELFGSMEVEGSNKIRSDSDSEDACDYIDLSKK